MFSPTGIIFDGEGHLPPIIAILYSSTPPSAQYTRREIRKKIMHVTHFGLSGRMDSEALEGWDTVSDTSGGGWRAMPDTFK